MKNIIKLDLKNMVLIAIFAVTSSLFLAGVLNLQTVGAQANIKGSLCKGAEDLSVGGPKTCEKPEGNETTLNELIKDIINIFSVIVGIIAVVMIIYGGLKFITSGGDSGRLTSAKQTILYAIIGLIIVALAQFIVRFILSKTPTS